MRLILLSDKFYRDYSGCEEILQKDSRPYMCLAVSINGETFAIPFRHHIQHKYAFFTKPRCGLDYSKAVVISSEEYISSVSPRIDQMEFNAVKGKDARIQNGMEKYIKLYNTAKRYKETFFYYNILKCSSLQYFEEYL